MGFDVRAFGLAQTAFAVRGDQVAVEVRLGHGESVARIEGASVAPLHTGTDTKGVSCRSLSRSIVQSLGNQGLLDARKNPPQSAIDVEHRWEFHDIGNLPD